MKKNFQSTLFIYLIALWLTIANFNAHSIQQNTSQLVQTTNNEWQKLLNKQQFDRIIDTSNAILEIDSNNQDALFYQGMAYYQSQREDLASPFFVSLINQHQYQLNHINAYRLALCHFYLNNNPQAIELLNIVLAQSNPPAKAQVTLAYALAKNNQLKQAVKIFDKLIANQPNYSLHYNRAMVYWSLNKLSAAEQDLLRAVALNPDFQLPYFDLISIYVTQNKDLQAYRWLGSLLQKHNVNLSRLQQDPILTDFIASEQYQTLLSRYQ